MRVNRVVRPFVLATAGLPLAAFALALAVGGADATEPYAATATVSHAPQYLGDATGTAFTFTVTNTGTEASIGAVEIERPSNGWSLTSCGSAPLGWTVQTADPRCRYRSTVLAADDIQPGQSRQFTVTATTLPGTADRVGSWNVVVSKSNQFDNPSLLTAAEAAPGGLLTTAYTWEVTDAVVSASAVATGSACPPSDKDEQTNETVTMVVCGRNHATVALTPTSGYSSLGGTFLQQSGVFSSGLIPANSGNVVVANWTGAQVVGQPGENLTVVATIGSAGNQTSPITTLTGYEAINAPPVAEDDAYSVAEDGWLAVVAPGVLGNDDDPENQPMTAVLANGPTQAAAFQLNSDGSFSYTPVANFAGTDSFTYNAHDGIQASNTATVQITVTAVNDAPVNTAPASVTTNEDTAYVFAPNALSVSDIDSGAADVETHLTVANASVTVGTSGVAVTGNGTGDVTVTGPVSAVGAALDGATLTPAADFYGSTTLTIATSDLGNTGSGGALTDTDNVAVTVNPVNDAPSFTPGGDQTVNEDAGTQTVVGWATDISAGPANESGQTLAFQVSNDNPSLFQTAPAVSPSGTLTYRAADGASGVAVVTVVLTDSGGTANGGDDTSDAETFTITVTGVNDPPTAADHTRAAQANMKVTLSGLLAGANDPEGQTVTLTSVTPLSCAGCVISNVNPSGSVDLDPPAGGTGTYTLAYTVSDSGGAESAPATITVNVSGPVIWFVDPSVAGPGTGRLSDPFSALPSATAVATSSGSRIFVYTGTVSGNVSQPVGGWLVGQGVSGASFDAVMGISPPAGTIARPSVNGTPPTVQGSVALADNSVVRGLALAPPSGSPGLVGNGDDALTVGEVSVTSTNASAVDVEDSQGSTIALSSVSATGAPNGIRLDTVNNTTAGSFSVSGGTVSGSTGAGVSLTTVTGVSLTGMTVSGSAGEGVLGNAVTTFSLSSSTVSGSGLQGVSMANLHGTSSMTGVTVHSSASDNARVFTSSGTTNLTVADSVFRDNSDTTGGNGLWVQADGSAAVSFTTTNSQFLRNRFDGLLVRALSTAKMNATITGGTWVQDSGVGLNLVSNAAGGLGYAVSGGTVTGCLDCSTPVNVFKGTGGTGTGTNAMAGSISGLTISNGDSTNAPGIWVRGEGPGASRIALTNNTVTAVANIGIHVAAGNGGSTMDATVTGNTVTLVDPLALQGVQVDAGTVSTDTVAVCADIKTNTVVSPTSDVRVRNRMVGTTYRLPGYAGAATSTSSVTAFLIAQNTITDAAAVVGSSPGFAGGGACAAP